ncbi:MAG: hypothetical protein ACRD63_07550 [Pyrinomonadaceae bacterium]
MELNDKDKLIVQELGDVINSAIEQSEAVISVINRLRDAGFELDLTIRLEIGLRSIDQSEGDTDSDASGDVTTRLKITDQDRLELRRMKIRFDED